MLGTDNDAKRELLMAMERAMKGMPIKARRVNSLHGRDFPTDSSRFSGHEARMQAHETRIRCGLNRRVG